MGISTSCGGVVPHTTNETLKQTAITVASFSVDTDDCSELLDMLGIDLNEVYSKS